MAGGWRKIPGKLLRGEVACDGLEQPTDPTVPVHPLTDLVLSLMLLERSKQGEKKTLEMYPRPLGQNLSVQMF